MQSLANTTDTVYVRDFFISKEHRVGIISSVYGSYKSAYESQFITDLQRYKKIAEEVCTKHDQLILVVRGDKEIIELAQEYETIARSGRGKNSVSDTVETGRARASKYIKFELSPIDYQSRRVFVSGQIIGFDGVIYANRTRSVPVNIFIEDRSAQDLVREMTDLLLFEMYNEVRDEFKIIHEYRNKFDRLVEKGSWENIDLLSDFLTLIENKIVEMEGQKNELSSSENGLLAETKDYYGASKVIILQSKFSYHVHRLEKATQTRNRMMVSDENCILESYSRKLLHHYSKYRPDDTDKINTIKDYIQKYSKSCLH